MFDGHTEFGTAADEAKDTVEDMDVGGVFQDAIDRVTSVLARVFTISFPEVGRSTVITFEVPAYLGVSLPNFTIDLENYQYIELLRSLQVIALAIWGLRQCMHIFNATFQ